MNGRLSSQEHYLRSVAPADGGLDGEVSRAWGSMFLPEPCFPNVFAGSEERYRLMLLSNTNEIHFDFVIQHYPILKVIEERLLSTKPVA